MSTNSCSSGVPAAPEDICATDVGPVESNLAGRVTLEIEELRGKLRYLRDRVQDATITVWFVQEYEPPEESSPGPLGWIFYGVYLGVKWLFVWDEPGPGR